MMKEGKLIMEGELYDYVKNILSKIIINGQINQKRNLFIIRDDTPNAFNMGDNNVFVNLGLIYKLNFEDELAFTIGHELGHNELKHSESSIIDYADLIVNDSIQSKIKEIKRSEYRHVTSLNELMIPWLLANKSKSRLHENEADAFGQRCIIASGYDMQDAIGIFDILEQEDKDVDSTFLDLSTLLKLQGTQLDFTRALKPKIESSLGSFEENEDDTLSDLLRSHPFGEERENHFRENLKSVEKNEEKSLQKRKLYKYYKLIAQKEIIADAIHTASFDIAVYHALDIYRNDSTDLFANKVIPFSFAYLGYMKIRRHAGSILNTNSPYYGKSFNQLIYFLREISPDQSYSIAKHWNKIYIDKSSYEISNASETIIDLEEKNEDNFKIRYNKEELRLNNYYIQSILKKIKNEND